nr:immunoglobulin heavy chain junction region [Mus musculus]
CARTPGSEWYFDVW